MTVTNVAETFSHYTGDDANVDLRRAQSTYDPLYTYRIPPGEDRHYAQQYADLYFLRQQKLRKTIEVVAESEWKDFVIAGEKAKHVQRVLDVRQGELSWIVGTIFADLPLKPNVLDDVTEDHNIAEAPPRQSYHSTAGHAAYMLEDRSGRLRLAGAMLQTHLLVTGSIVACLGTENANGEFDVLRMQFPDLPPQLERWDVGDEAEEEAEITKTDPNPTPGKKIAFISGLQMSGSDTDMAAISMLAEYLLGEALGQSDRSSSAHIARLIIAGNSIAKEVTEKQPIGDDEILDSLEPVYNVDAETYNEAPTTYLDSFLSEILPTLPVTLMPGEHDPVNFGLPQQPFHTALLPRARSYATTNLSDPQLEEPGWFESVTNPWDGFIDGWTMMGNSGQPVDDIIKYVDLKVLAEQDEADIRLDVMEAMLRWRSAAPTCPDTLWCYPYQDRDPFVLTKCPHVFFVGNQAEFRTAQIEGYDGQLVRIFTIPSFKDTGEMILLDTETLQVEVVKFETDESEQA